MNGLLLVNKAAGISSFGAIERIQNHLRTQKIPRKQWPKLGHGGTLDPFATGLLPVCVGRAVKLARYFLGADKTYEGVIRFGETTAPGDPTGEITETSDHLPASVFEIQTMATKLSQQPYLQMPPMFSAKKKNGSPLYLLAREGIEVEREAKLCHLYEFEVLKYEAPRAWIRVKCSSGTYIRTLAQDLGRLMGSVALLESLNRSATAHFTLDKAQSLQDIESALENKTPWDELSGWIPFDRMLDGHPRVQATAEERQALIFGQQSILINLLRRAPAESAEGSFLAIYFESSLLAIARKTDQAWSLERVFTET